MPTYRINRRASRRNKKWVNVNEPVCIKIYYKVNYYTYDERTEKTKTDLT